jgi:demethylmenaquinone methyltransferase/2-methoxy-6-polyprenyl-1,4-benzoquinol methylase
VATGTGGLALEVLHQHSDLQVVGLDFVPEMLVQAQQKAVDAGTAVDLLAGDALRIPFTDGTFDAIVTGFALRNVINIPAAFSEMARVTRSGGRIACLEIAKPRLPLFCHLYAFYFFRLVPLLGGWIAGQRLAYTYLPHSLTTFLTPDEIVTVMGQAGWHDVSYRRLMLGTVVLHVGVREL